MVNGLNWQLLATAVLVAGCSGYALWSVLPAVLRSRLSAWCGRPSTLPAAACGGCSGCGAKPALPPGAAVGVAVIRIVRRPPAA